MRVPLEYGDNFPVPTGSWNPSVPWRFPKHELLPNRPSLIQGILPWITLGLGVVLGLLWVNWQEKPQPDWNPPPVQRTPPAERSDGVFEEETNPKPAHPMRKPPPARLAIRRV